MQAPPTDEARWPCSLGWNAHGCTPPASRRAPGGSCAHRCKVRHSAAPLGSQAMITLRRDRQTPAVARRPRRKLWTAAVAQRSGRPPRPHPWQCHLTPPRQEKEAATHLQVNHRRIQVLHALLLSALHDTPVVLIRIAVRPGQEPAQCHIPARQAWIRHTPAAYRPPNRLHGSKSPVCHRWRR